jgi:hypothetical protein
VLCAAAGLASIGRQRCGSSPTAATSVSAAAGSRGRRKLPDTAVLSGGPPPFAGPLLTGGIERAAARLLARTVDVNWALASRLLGAAVR